MIYQEILPKSILSSRKVYFTLLESYGFNLVSANHCFKESFLISNSLQQKPFDFFIDPKDKALFYETIENCIQNPGLVYPLTIWMGSNEQSSRETSWRFVAVPVAGNHLQIECTGYENTQEENLQVKISNDSYEVITKLTNEAIWDFDIINRTITCTKSYKLLFGHDFTDSADALDFWINHIHPDEKEQVIAGFNEFISQNETSFWFSEYRFERKDGTFATVFDKAYLLFDNEKNPVRVIGCMQDITESKVSLRDMEDQRKFYESILNNIPADIAVFNSKHEYLFVNPKGIKDDHLRNWIIGKRDEDYCVYRKKPMRIAKERRAKFNKAIATLKPNEYEERIIKPDGTEEYVLRKWYPVTNSDNKVEQVIGYGIDITGRKLLEKQLLLKQKEKQNEIAQAAVEAQERERAEIGKELHDNVSHLLTTTKLYLELFAFKNSDENDLIKTSVQQINSVISEIRALSKSLVPSSIIDLGLVATINDLAENFQSFGNIKIEFAASDDIEELMNKKLKLTLYRILQEQISNIIKYASAEKIEIDLFEENNKIHLMVTDDGIGFDINKIKPGLGLKNMRSRAELMGGKADILTEPGKGCKLTVKIPINI